MNSRYKTLAKDTVIFAIGSLGSKLILFFLVPLYTNYLSTEEYGSADLVSTFVQLIVPFSAIVINQSLVRFGMKKDAKEQDVLKAAFFVFVISIFISLAYVPFLSLYRPISEWKWYLFILVILTNCTEIEKAYLKVKNRNRHLAAICIIQTLVLALVNVVAITVYHFGVKGYLFAQIIALFFTTVAAFFAGGIFGELCIGKVQKNLVKQMIVFSFPLVFSNVSWWVIHSSDKIMIEWMIGASMLGIYTAATKIPSLINVIIGIFNQAWGLSSIREIESTNDESFYVSVFDFFCTFLVATCIFFVSLIKPFMEIYVGIDFREAWQYTPLLLVAAVFYSVSAFIGSLYVALQKTRNDMWTSLLCAIINIVINYIGIKIMGTWGAVVGTVSAYFVISTIRLYDIRKHMKFNINLSIYCFNVLLMLIHAALISVNWNILLVSVICGGLFIIVNRSSLILIVKKICKRRE